MQNVNNVFTLSQTIDNGSGSFYKLGAGTLDVTNGGTYVGSTVMAGGTLKLTNPMAVPWHRNRLFCWRYARYSRSHLWIYRPEFQWLRSPYGNTPNVTLGYANINGGVNVGGGTLLVDSNMGDGTQSTTVNLGTFSAGIGAATGTSNTGATLMSRSPVTASRSSQQPLRPMVQLAPVATGFMAVASFIQMRMETRIGPPPLSPLRTAPPTSLPATQRIPYSMAITGRMTIPTISRLTASL